MKCMTSSGIRAELLSSNLLGVSIQFRDFTTDDIWVVDFPATYCRLPSYRRPDNTFSAQGFKDMANDYLGGLI